MNAQTQYGMDWVNANCTQDDDDREPTTAEEAQEYYEQGEREAEAAKHPDPFADND